MRSFVVGKFTYECPDCPPYGQRGVIGGDLGPGAWSLRDPRTLANVVRPTGRDTGRLRALLLALLCGTLCFLFRRVVDQFHHVVKGDVERATEDFDPGDRAMVTWTATDGA